MRISGPVPVSLHTQPTLAHRIRVQSCASLFPTSYSLSHCTAKNSTLISPLLCASTSVSHDAASAHPSLRTYPFHRCNRVIPSSPSPPRPPATPSLASIHRLMRRSPASSSCSLPRISRDPSMLQPSPSPLLPSPPHHPSLPLHHHLTPHPHSSILPSAPPERGTHALARETDAPTLALALVTGPPSASRHRWTGLHLKPPPRNGTEDAPGATERRRGGGTIQKGQRRPY